MGSIEAQCAPSTLPEIADLRQRGTGRATLTSYYGPDGPPVHASAGAAGPGTRLLLSALTYSRLTTGRKGPQPTTVALRKVLTSVRERSYRQRWA